MRVITTRAELVGWLFQELRRAEPQRTVDSSFLIAFAAVCQGLSSGARARKPDCWSPDYLPTRPGQPVLCGLKLVKLARSLAEEGVLDCTRVWSASPLIRRMVAAFDSPGLRVERGQGLASACVTTSRSFAAERGVKVQVRLGRRWRSRPVFHRPRDLAMPRRAELEEALRAGQDELMRIRRSLEATERRQVNLQTQVERAMAALRAEQQRVIQLQIDLGDAQHTIQQQHQRLANTPTGSGNPLFRRVGLHENCPDFVLKAARRAYALALHPDHRPGDQQRAAEERLKEANAVFDDLYSLRNIR